MPAQQAQQEFCLDAGLPMTRLNMEDAETDMPPQRRSLLRSFLDMVNCLNTEDDDDSEEKTIMMQRRKSEMIDKQIKLDKKEFKATYRLLLLGDGESGKSTIVKQMKILHQNGYNREERLRMVADIRTNVIDAITTIVEEMPNLNPPEKMDLQENEAKRLWILDYDKKNVNVYTEEFYDTAAVLWKDQGVQNAYERSNEYQLIDCAKYFLDKIDEVRQESYVPSDQDILYCRVLTSRIIETRFKINNVTFHLYDVGGQKNERRKWIQCFYDVTAIMFVCSCSSYDMTLREDKKRNRLVESFELFSQIWNNRWLCTRSVIMFLNKCDLLAEKIKKGHSKFEDYFPDICNISEDVKYFNMFKKFNEPTEVLRVMYYIQDKFVKTSAKTQIVELSNGTVKEHLLYPHFTCAVNTENIKLVFDDCRDIIQRIHLAEMLLI